MQPISDKNNKYLHSKLPIDDDETIVAVFRHHWFVYVSTWLVGVGLAVIIMVAAGFLVGAGAANAASGLAAHRSQILLVAGVFSTVILLFTFIPVYLRSQEQLVLTDESLLQVLQPSLFASKVDSVSLQRIDDISVRQDFLGTMFGFGHMTVETPGEQDNYEFNVLPQPHDAARQISKTKEDFEAALNAGRLPSPMGLPAQPAAPVIDPQQYQQFLEYQQMVARQNQDAAAQTQPTLPAQPQQDQQLPPQPPQAP